jgi:NADH:ubiquinone oxidoreductase subunit B-like Fe-S oxidoreductase
MQCARCQHENRPNVKFCGGCGAGLEVREALERTYQATPHPKWVVAVGDCARDGGVFSGSYACVGGVSAVLPVDLHIRGCPPSPIALLKGLLALLECVDRGTAAAASEDAGSRAQPAAR